MSSQDVRSTHVAAPSLRYCGRDFSPEELVWIDRLIAENPELTRARLSRRVCEHLDWIKPDGSLKEMSCRVAMLRMHRDGILELPPPRNGNVNGRHRPQATEATDPKPALCMPAGALGALSFRMVNTRRESSLWNELIERYHYLGYMPLAGAQIRYLVSAGPDLLAAMGFGAAAWALGPRDVFIGWSAVQRKKNLHLVVNNARYLILPWVRSKCLASRILATAARKLPDDWQARYGYKPVLMETFVLSERFSGTCYRAANWTYVGQTTGRGKLDRSHKHPVPLKDVFVYPLHRKFRTLLGVQEQLP